MSDFLQVGPTNDPRVVLGPRGQRLEIPAGWALLPPGDAAITRRVKAAGPSWQVVETKGRKKFSRGLWAPAPHIEAARSAVTLERADPAHERRLAQARQRRERAEQTYAVEFANAVLSFLAFAPSWQASARKLAVIVSEHATPVGSGTVARTERIPVEQRAEAAVIAWLRHQTTAYDQMKIARVKGSRREVRRALAEQSRLLLDRHRREAFHGPEECALCTALLRPPGAF